MSWRVEGNQIDALGGWGVKLGDFSIAFIHAATKLAVNPRKSLWPVQSYESGKRSKRIFVVKIPQSGMYSVEIKNPESLKVRPSNLFVRSLFEQPIENERLETSII